MRFWPKTDSRKPPPEAPKAYARADHAMVKINNKVFFIGGIGESPEKVMSYNLNYGEWSVSYAVFDDPLYAS